MSEHELLKNLAKRGIEKAIHDQMTTVVERLTRI